MLLTDLHMPAAGDGIAVSVADALCQIGYGGFDVLLTDLHMPAAGDGIKVVSAMSHSNPLAVTLVFSGYPEMQAALSAILLQADEVLVKPLDIPMSIFDQTPQILDGKVLCDDHALYGCYDFFVDLSAGSSANDS